MQSPQIEQELQHYCSSISPEIILEKTTKHSLTQLICNSNFAYKLFKSKPFLVTEILKENLLVKSKSKTIYQKQLKLIQSANEVTFYKLIREFRNREMFRIAWRAVGLHIDLKTILVELSGLADACILEALSYISRLIYPKFSTTLPKEVIDKLYVLALGKLGGYELNFSSDVDIFFAFPSSPNIDQTQLSLYFTKVVKSLLNVLSQQTVDGFVYRVDLRLRPNGDAGPLAMSFQSLETYYQEQGRDWERYALTKARIINKGDKYTDQLKNICIPFVYRKYIDFSIIESLRSLKSVIQREVKLKHMAGDIKRGPGGIREVEFICQAHQIVRGGRDSELRSSSIFNIMDILLNKKTLPVNSINKLIKAYIFYREVENAIQILNDRQCHSMPNDEQSRLKILAMLNISSWSKLEKQLKIYRNDVNNIFEGMLASPHEAENDQQKILLLQIKNMCQGLLDLIPREDFLISLGFQDPEQIYFRISSLFNSRKYLMLSQIAKIRLEKFLPILISEIQQYDEIDKLFLKILSLLEKVLKRSTYLALMMENPSSIKHLLKLFNLSPWIEEHVSSYPFLLEVLLDEEALYKPLSEDELDKSLSDSLVEVKDLEYKLEIVKQFKLMQQLRVVSAKVVGLISSSQVSEHLSRTATVILKKVLDLAQWDLLSHYPDAKAYIDQFAIIGYGKLGSSELLIDSDLDLVFLHNVQQSGEIFITRLARKILHFLSNRSYGGVLYKVDTRLRPSGSAGLLISNIESFERYQVEKAWLWEHQAIVKARFITGDKQLKQKFIRIRRDILMRVRDYKVLAEDISNMRHKMKNSNLINEQQRIKNINYGLVDLEFMSQYIVLRYANKNPELCVPSSVEGIFKLAKELGILETNEFNEILPYLHQLQESLTASQLEYDYQNNLITPPQALLKKMEAWSLNFC